MLGGIGTADASPTLPYFAALPESGETELHVARYAAVAAPLRNGEVLIAGGEGENEVALQSVELFNPATDTFTLLAESGQTELQIARAGAVAVPLQNGEVLIAGGHNVSGPLKSNAEPLTSAELFNPTTDSFTLLPESGNTELQIPRAKAVAAPLGNGQVLIAGGCGERAERNAELFNPVTDAFTALPASGDTELQAKKRCAAAAAPLPDGKVLIATGSYTETAELFNPATDTFSALPAALHAERYAAVAATLPGGQVLIAGTAGGCCESIHKSAELFNPITESFTALPESSETELHIGRGNAVAAPLPGGRVLIAGGGWGIGSHIVRSAEIYYSAPQPEIAGGYFGAQTVNEPAAEQVLNVTNVGSETLEISSAYLIGADTTDFWIVADQCVGRKLEIWQSCTISARFTPSSTGERYASLILEDNGPSPTTFRLSGIGVSPNSGPTGPQGPQGSTGLEGAVGPQGAAGAQGAPGPQGVAGPQGAAGPQGGVGPRGPAGEVEIVTCKPVATGERRKIVQKCTGKLTSSSVTTMSSVVAVLSRGKVIYATGSAIRSHNRMELTLIRRYGLRSGKYTLTLTWGRKQQRETITVA